MPSLFQRNRLDAELAAARSKVGREFVSHRLVYLIIAVWRHPEKNWRPAPDGPICMLAICLRWRDPYSMRCLEWREYKKKFLHNDWQYRMPLPSHEPREMGYHMAQTPTYPIGQSPQPTPDWPDLDRTTNYHEFLKQKHGTRRFNRARKLARQFCLSIQYWLEIASPEKFASGHPVTSNPPQSMHSQS